MTTPHHAIMQAWATQARTHAGCARAGTHTHAGTRAHTRLGAHAHARGRALARRADLFMPSWQDPLPFVCIQYNILLSDLGIFWVTKVKQYVT